MKTPRAPEEDIRHHNTLHWATLFHEGKGLSPLRMASGFLPTTKGLMAFVNFSSPSGMVETIVSQQIWDF